MLQMTQSSMKQNSSKSTETSYVYLTVEKDIQIDRKPIGMLAVDAGLHNIATTVNSLERKSSFYGKELPKSLRALLPSSESIADEWRIRSPKREWRIKNLE